MTLLIKEDVHFNFYTLNLKCGFALYFSLRWSISAPYGQANMLKMTVKFPLTRTSPTVPAKFLYVFFVSVSDIKNL